MVTKGGQGGGASWPGEGKAIYGHGGAGHPMDNPTGYSGVHVAGGGSGGPSSAIKETDLQSIINKIASLTKDLENNNVTLNVLVDKLYGCPPQGAKTGSEKPLSSGTIGEINDRLDVLSELLGGLYYLTSKLRQLV